MFRYKCTDFFFGILKPNIHRLYLNDKELNIVSYSLLLPVLEYQTAVMRGDFETADRVLPTVPHDHRTRVAHFLEKQVNITIIMNVNVCEDLWMFVTLSGKIY